MSDMFFALIFLLLIIISALCSGIAGGMFSLNHYQLKRKAQLGDEKAKTVYPIHGLGYQLLVTLLLVNVAANATLAIILHDKLGGLFAILFSTVFILFFGEILPMLYLRKHVIAIVAVGAPLLRRLVSITAPVVRPVARTLDKMIGQEAQLFYSKEELLRMFDAQKLAKESDVAADELRMIRSMLRFGDKKIRDCMTPRRMVTVVAQDDEVGAGLMDELYKSGHSRFPVISEPKEFTFVGTLYLRDLVGQKSMKKVASVMSQDVRYVHEEESLDHALRAFLRTHHHLFVVVNNFEEFVGVLSIEDVLEEIIGKEIVDEFDAHHDLRAVAQSIAEKERKAREKNGTTDKK
jgi:CBS domain containing-hemolysin-like protein